MTEPKEVNLFELSDLRTPWCIYVVVTLRIAEHIAAGIDHIDGLASAAGCDADVLQRVLDHLVGKGVFVEPASGRFSLNRPARELMEPGAHLAYDLEGLGGRFAGAWSTLLSYVRTGQPAYANVFGRPFWEDLAAHPELSAQFDDLIGPDGHGAPEPQFELNGGWQAVHTLVDVGGGTGAMLAEILRIRPGLRGILVDQPATVARSAGIFQAAGVTDRVTTAGQSFFDPLPPGADLYLLRGILNDWPDREVIAILKCCAEAARPSGRVVILKGVMPDGAPKELSIEGILLGGKQRSQAEMAALARAAGMEVVRSGQQANGYFVVECRPV